MGELSFEIEHNTYTAAQNYVHKQLSAFNNAAIQTDNKFIFFTVIVKKHHNTVAGATIHKRKSAFYIDALWCAEHYRHTGIGSKIIHHIEAEAQKQGVCTLFVDTFDFQAEGFYIKNKFKKIGVIPAYLDGHARIFLRKNLDAVA